MPRPISATDETHDQMDIKPTESGHVSNIVSQLKSRMEASSMPQTSQLSFSDQVLVCNATSRGKDKFKTLEALGKQSRKPVVASQSYQIDPSLEEVNLDVNDEEPSAEGMRSRTFTAISKVTTSSGYVSQVGDLDSDCSDTDSVQSNYSDTCTLSDFEDSLDKFLTPPDGSPPKDVTI